MDKELDKFIERAAIEANKRTSVPGFDLTQPTELERMIRGDHWSGVDMGAEPSQTVLTDVVTLNSACSTAATAFNTAADRIKITSDVLSEMAETAARIGRDFDHAILSQMYAYCAPAKPKPNMGSGPVIDVKAVPIAQIEAPRKKES